MAWDDIKTSGLVIPSAEWNDMVADQKDRVGLIFNVQSDSASPDGGTATTGSITAATNSLVVASASTFAKDQGIVIVGAKLDTTDTGNTEDADNDFTTTGGAADNEWMARGFTATASGAVGTVANVMLKKTGAPAGTILAAIFTDDGGGPSGPSGTQVGGNSTAVTNTTLNASGAIQTFTWSTDWPVLTTGVKYWLVLKTVGYTYTNGVTEVIWQTDANGAVAGNECWKYDSNAGPTWTTMGADLGADITINLNLQTTISVVSGTTLTLSANATTTVSSAVVRHDEVVAIQAAHTSATASGGYVWFPVGTYNVSSAITTNADSPLWFDPGATLSVNSGVTVTVANMIRPTHTVFTGSGSLVSAVQAITAAGDTILANAKRVVLDPDGNYTMTSTPTIADGTFGQRVTLTVGNAEANSVTLQDQDTLASSNIQLHASTRVISAKTAIDLEFDGSDWVEVGGSGGMTTFTGGATIGAGTKHDGYVIADAAEVQTSDDTQTTCATLTLLDENTYMVEALVVGVQDDGTDRASYKIACTVYRTGAGGATLQGAVTIMHAQESNAALDATFTVNGNDLRVSVTGIAAETWEWGTTLISINMSET